MLGLAVFEAKLSKFRLAEPSINQGLRMMVVFTVLCKLPVSKEHALKDIHIGPKI